MGQNELAQDTGYTHTVRAQVETIDSETGNPESGKTDELEKVKLVTIDTDRK